MDLTYSLDRVPEVDQLIALYHSAGLPRPLSDHSRIADLCKHTTLWATAWKADQLLGVARCLTDFRWCCYLADLAVHAEYQRQGIGRQLIARTKHHLGEECMVLLLAVPTAMDYYPRAGMRLLSNAFILDRER